MTPYRNPLTRALAHTPWLYRCARGVYMLGAHPRQSLKRAYRRLSRSGIFFEQSEMSMCSLLPRATLDLMIERYRPSSVLDVGCGTGESISYLVEHGVDARGIEGSSLARAHAKQPELITQHDLRRPITLPRRFDLVFSYEVAEHIHAHYLDALLHNLTHCTDRVIMTAARPGQGGEGHFNEQPPEYWIDNMKRVGFDYDLSATNAFRALDDEFSVNALVFTRAKL